jgi:parallel beta-helix repeat protein
MVRVPEGAGPPGVLAAQGAASGKERRVRFFPELLESVMNARPALPLRKRPLVRLIAVFAVVLAFACIMRVARAETYDTCAGFIDSLPAVLTSQGVWCLRGDLSTSMASGNAIEIAANNVTLDCNGFKIGGQAAGSGSTTAGIHAFNRQNATVRHCNVRGFFRGIDIGSGAGHLIEDNRLDNNLYFGISATGDNNLVRRNRVFDTGGGTGITTNYGIYAGASVIDNLVDGVDATAATHAIGIRLAGSGQVARGNVVRNLAAAASGQAYGILAISGVRVQGNHIHAGSATGTVGYGFRYGAVCTDNTVYGFSTPYADCAVSVDNMPTP